MARVDSNHSDILDAVAARLISQISGYSASNCFVTLEPMPFPFPQHNQFMTVCPSDGVFDDAIIEGAGVAACAENSNVIVTCASRIMLDQVAQHRTLISDQSRGLLVTKRLILKALTAHDLIVGSNAVLRNFIAPVKALSPGYDREARLGWLSIVFALDFDWDLAT